MLNNWSSLAQSFIALVVHRIIKRDDAIILIRNIIN